MAINRHITHIKSSGTENGQPKLPTTSQIEFGEIAVNYADGYETLSIKNNASTPEIVTFSSDDKFYKKTETSGSSEISSALSGKSDTGHTHSQYLTAITSGDVTTALGYTPERQVTYSSLSISSNQTNVTCPVTLTNDGDQCNVIYINNTTDHTISVSTTYKSPDGKQPNITVKANGYAEINYLKMGDYICVRCV